MSTARRAGPILAAAALLTCLALPDPGRAVAGPPEAEPAPTWGPIRVLSEYGWDPSPVVAPDGSATVVWAAHFVRGPILAMDYRRSQGWGDAVVIGHGARPVLVADAAGNLTAVWNTNRRGMTTGVAAAYRPAGGGWQPGVDLSLDVAAADYNPSLEDTFGAGPVDLAVAPDGTAVAAWHWGSFEREDPFRVQAVRRPAGGAWGAPVDVTPANWSHEPRVALDATGSAVLVYAGDLAGPGSPVRARTGSPDGDWSAAVTLSRRAYPHQVAVDAAGNAVAIFHQGFRRVHAAYRPAAGEWQRPVALSPRGAMIEEAELRMEPGGTATLLWSRATGRVDVVRRPAGGEWRRPVMLADRRQGGYSPALSVADGGAAFAMWGSWNLTGRYRGSDGRWSDPLRVERRDVYAADRVAAVGPGGDVLAVWVGEEQPVMARWLRLRESTPGTAVLD